MPAGTDALEGDPLVSAYFAIDLAGGASGFFTEVSGLGSETEIVEMKIMGENNTEIVRKIPGRLKWGDITLKRGITTNMDMWDWRKMVEDGDVVGARKNGSIMMFDQEGTEVARWNFEKGWPSKISGPSPKSDGNEIAIEELTLVHEFIERVT
ncbi:MAG: phage tail protein [Candidatus Promineifilaceae bacterium]|nr:phage tail protein [Candidatus Promineifilaceae bacterium]